MRTLTILFLEQSTGNVYIMMESRIESFLKKESETLYSTRTEIYEVVEKLKGEVLSGLKYIPLFPYFQKVCLWGYASWVSFFKEYVTPINHWQIIVSVG